MVIFLIEIINLDNIYIILLCVDEILFILSKDIPNNWSSSIYQSFLTVFMGSFYGSCRDLVELKHLVI